MKIFNIKFTSLLLVLFAVFSINLFAVVIDTDTFDSDTDGWSGTGVTQSNSKLRINNDNTASKTYTFTGKGNKIVTFTLQATEIRNWENSDELEIYVDGVKVIDDNIDGTETKTFTATLDSDGKTTISIKPNTNRDREDIYIDNISVDVAGAADDYYTTDINTPLSANVLDNDSGTNLTSTILSQPIKGTLSFSSDGSFTYTPETDFEGDDSFTYTVEDDDGEQYTATVYITVSLLNIETEGGRLFELRDQQSLFGDVSMIGNTVICKINSSTGSCIETTSANGNTFLSKTPESYSTLSLATNVTVKYARLYWQGRQDSIDWTTAEKNNAKSIDFRFEDDSFVTFTADILDYNDEDEWDTYSASALVTDYIQTHQEGKYYVDPDTFYTVTGQPDILGAYGAWVLVVVYEDPDEPSARNITIFDGYQIIEADNPVDISVSGFLTPRTGSVDSHAYVFVAEGDKFYTGDDLLMKGELSNTTFTSIAADSNNAFDSRIDVSGVRSPSLENNNGIDIHQYNVGTSGENIITTNEVGATFRFTSNLDVYFPSLIVFSTELYLPKLCYDYSIRQDGVFLPVDRDAYPVAQLNGQISSSPLEISVYLRNEEADMAAEGIALKVDINNSIFDHDPSTIYTSNTNGSTLIDRGTPTTSTPLCDYDKNGNNSFTNSGCTTGNDLRKGLGALDAHDYIYTKFSLTPKGVSGISDLNQSLGLSLKYYITADGNKIEYPDYLLGGINVPLCPTAVSYQPSWGQFNVVQAGQTQNNIYTQISRKSFNVDVIFDSTPSTGDHTAPTSEINTTVLVEMIDLDSFGDINASCANPDSGVTDPIFVELNFDNTSYSKTVAVQGSDYYNFATKNTAFRIWYFSDDDGILSQNWNALTYDTQRLDLLSISGLYDSSKHQLCESSCLSDTSTDCFSCIRANYAKALCSRDNFSVRPESYNVKILDDNQSASATSVNLSDVYQYAPDFAIPTDSMQLTTDYQYRFDIIATGHDSLNQVPRYTRYFNGADDYNATMIWNSTQTGCNDTDSRNITFYVKSGLMEDEQRSQDQIGQYILNLQDISWTAVDWKYTDHHIAAKNFATTDDCQLNFNKSTTTQAQNGCLITTDHGTDGNGRVYKDINITFHPYKFSVDSIMPTVGINRDIITVNNSFIYMADRGQDANMSYHLDGSIVAESFTGNPLSNFVSNCYAQPLNIAISRTNTLLLDENNNSVTYSLQFSDINSTGDVVIADNIDLNDTNVDNNMTVVTTSAHFYKLQNGTMTTRLNLNYDRAVDTTANPIAISFTNYSVKCVVANDCQFKAHQTDKELDADKTLTDTIAHYYGRSNSPRQKFVHPVGSTVANPAVDFIYYEVYCNGATCDKTLLQDVNSTATDDPRWFVNSRHTASYGSAGLIAQKSGDAYVTGSNATGNAPDATNLVYTGAKGYPFRTTMQHSPSRWLIYNKYNATVTNNDFDVEFIKNDGNWAGKDRANSTTNTSSSLKSNRRSMW